MSARTTIDVNHSMGRYRIALTRVPCVGERVAFKVFDDKRTLHFCVVVIGVEHYDIGTGDGADALIGVKDLHE